MGCCCAKMENEVIEGPPDQFPYHGPPIEHLFMNTLVKSRYKITLGTRTCFTSNTNQVYPRLAEKYNLGFRFLEFLPFPYTVIISGFRTTKQEYQAIFYKDPTEEPSNLWQLHVEQASHYTESTFCTSGWRRKMTTTYNMSELFGKITQLTANGGRYLGLTQTGLDTDFHGFMNVKIKGAVFVDLLFEVPRHPPQEIYVYRTLCQQVTTKLEMYGIECNFDYLSTVDSHLAEGWRLITAFMDTGAYNLASQRQMGVGKTEIECLYVFEKPSSRLHDNRRRYEVKVIEFPYKLTSNCGTIEPLTMWSATIENMGRQGWYITTILPTPRIYNGMCDMTTMVLLYFQRKLF